MVNKPQHIIVHHSVTPRDLNADTTEASFNKTHKARGFPSTFFQGKTWHIGYHYVIYGDGELRQYRDHKTVGAHCRENTMNYQSIGICLAGSFDTEYPSPEQLASLKELIEKLQELFPIPDKNISPHRKYATYKSCWGSRLPDNPLEVFRVGEPSDYAEASWGKAIAGGVLDSGADPKAIIGEEALEAILMKVGMFKRTEQQGAVTQEDFIVAVDRMGLLD